MKYQEAKKNKTYNKDQYSEENLEYKIEYKKGSVKAKERRIFLDSDEEKQDKKKRELDINKQEIK